VPTEYLPQYPIFPTIIDAPPLPLNKKVKLSSLEPAPSAILQYPANGSAGFSSGACRASRLKFTPSGAVVCACVA